MRALCWAIRPDSELEPFTDTGGVGPHTAVYQIDEIAGFTYSMLTI